MTSFHLPMLEPHRATLEKCVYCPKLSRATCPVSNATASETLTPWGKMSMAYFAARGDVPVDEEHAAPAWGCSGCYACRERCEHKNEVAATLFDARAEMFTRGAAPAPARAAAERMRTVESEYRAAVARIEQPARADVALVLGCSYARHHPSVAADALAVARRCVGPFRAVSACCGLPWLHAGNRASFLAASRRLAAEVRGAKRVVAVDPGCAVALQRHYPAEAELPDVTVLVDEVYRSIETLPPLALAGRNLRWTDPCQLGRGLGRYEEPRAILARLTGEAPVGFLRERAEAECSGGGGLLPVTMPGASEAIADARVAEHEARGGGTLVTGCAQSLRRFKSRGVAAVDWLELVGEAWRGAR